MEIMTDDEYEELSELRMTHEEIIRGLRQLDAWLDSNSEEYELFEDDYQEDETDEDTRVG